MRSVLVAAALMASAGQTQALSCEFGDGAVAFGQARAIGAGFRTAVGELTWDAPATDINSGIIIDDTEGERVNFHAQFVGEVLRTSGAREDLNIPITVSSFCINEDCGYAIQNVPLIVFLHLESSGWVLHAVPCQSYPLRATEEEIGRVQACIDGGSCNTELRVE